MQIIEHQEIGMSRNQFIYTTLRSAMLQRNAYPTQDAQQLADNTHCFYSSILILPKARLQTPIEWKFTLGMSTLTVQLRLSPFDSQLAKIIEKLFGGRQQQLFQMLHLINQLGLCEGEGVFLGTKRGDILFRMRIPRVFLFPETVRLQRYLVVRLDKAASTFSREIQRIIMQFPPFAGVANQTSASKKLKEEEDSLIILKEIFEKNRKLREKSSKINLSWDYNKIVGEAIKLLHSGVSSVTKGKIKQNDKLVDDLQLKLISQKKQLKQNLQDEERSQQAILTGMKIKQTIRQKILCEGGYASIREGIYSFMTYKSLNPDEQQICWKQLKERIQQKLIKKISLSMQGKDIAIRNQMSFLHYIRNNICPYIAKYYCQVAKHDHFSDGIYLDHYPRSLAQKISRSSCLDRMNISYDVLMGLVFLKERGIIHRDVKEDNIMIDREHRARLIDFGSVAPIAGVGQFNPEDKRLRSTEGYFLPYKQAAAEVRSVGQKYSRGQFQTHESFDMYSMGVILWQQFNLDYNDYGDPVRQNLRYLSLKCKQANPDDRMQQDQAAIFMKHLIGYESKRRSVTNMIERRARDAEKGKMLEDKNQKSCD